jgi:ankyrin repeat protein
MSVKRLGDSLAGIALLMLCSVSFASAAENETRLVDAVKSGNRQAVRTLLKQPGQVNAPEADGTTALHYAVRSDDVQTVQLLLRAGANPNAANRYQVTPLGLAATNGNLALVESLLKAGADANAELADGETVLMRAARTGRADVVKLLIVHGGNVNAKERSLGETALMWAAAENHPEAVSLLAEAGASLNERSATMKYPPRVPGRSGLVSMALPKGHWTPVMYAAREGAVQAIRSLAAAGADLDLTDQDGANALNLALINGHYDAAAALLENGADPNVADSRGVTALYTAVDMHTLPWTLMRPSPKETDRLTSLDIMKLALDYGADPNARLKGPILPRQHTNGDAALNAGATPLMRAAKSGDMAAMRILLQYGADPRAVQKNGTNALMMAAGLGWREGFVAANDKGTEAEAIEAIKLCLELGLDINAQNEEGYSPLHAAVDRTDGVIKYLVSRGARLDLKDRYGRMPLDVALRGTATEVRNSNVRDTTAPLLRELMKERGIPIPDKPVKKIEKEDDQ